MLLRLFMLNQWMSLSVNKNGSSKTFHSTNSLLIVTRNLVLTFVMNSLLQQVLMLKRSFIPPEWSLMKKNSRFFSLNVQNYSNSLVKITMLLSYLDTIIRESLTMDFWHLSQKLREFWLLIILTLT